VFAAASASFVFVFFASIASRSRSSVSVFIPSNIMADSPTAWITSSTGTTPVQQPDSTPTFDFRSDFLRVALHGNVGAGKTAVLREIDLNSLWVGSTERPVGIVTVHKPVRKWINLSTTRNDQLDLLDLCVKEQAKYRFAFQGLVRSTYMPFYFTHPSPATVALMEQSIHVPALFPRVTGTSHRL
jgi:hypothetical protein